MTQRDPYLYPGTEVLINKLGIMDREKFGFPAYPAQTGHEILANY